MTEEDPKDVSEFVMNAALVCFKIAIGAIILGEYLEEEKESKRPPKKKCRKPPKYV